MGLAAARALGQLSRVDHVAAGLATLGNPDGFLERQVPRWLSEVDAYSAQPGYGRPELRHLDEVADWLVAECPSSFAPGVMHGDYHLSNLMFSRRSADVVAIVDWEMCTVGDPLMDLGWLLATWPTPDSMAAAQTMVGRVGGLPTRAEVIRAYAECSERDLSALTWYGVVACFKLGILLEGTYARACAGKADAATGNLLHNVALELFESAHRFIGEGL
jgi:aminoglycoside phosphotransferase (APT) family kinase protein